MVSTVLRVLKAVVDISIQSQCLTSVTFSIQSQCLTFPTFVLAFKGKVF